MKTKEQSLSPIWFSVRRFRLTASVFGQVYHFRPSTPPDSLVKTLLVGKVISTPAIEWGRINESVALQAYIKHKSDLGNTMMIVCKAGFCICEEHPYLGASPDGYVLDPQAQADSQYGLVEIKCPYKYRKCSLVDAAKHTDFFCSFANANNQPIVELKRNHQYVMQVQGQMAITDRKWCDFVLPRKFRLRGLTLTKSFGKKNSCLS